MNQGWIYQERVTPSHAGQTLLDYYTQQYRHSSAAQWQDRINSGQVLVDGKLTYAQTILQQGQKLTYHRPPWEEPTVPLDFEVLYEDADLLIIAKPAGLPVLPGGGFLEHTLLHQLQQHYPKSSLPVPIHRLGRGTSGLMLWARSPLAKSHLTQQMRDRTIRKTYRALVGSGPMPDQFVITHPIGKISHPELGYIYGTTPDGQFAHSDCRVLKRNPDTTLLEVDILTGRPHQIRIHLATAGHPLIGDPLYEIGGIPRLAGSIVGSKLPVPGDCGYSLHAFQLTFFHPTTEKIMHITCPIPDILPLLQK